MRVVLDTNVLLSGLMYPDSVPGAVVRAWREAAYDLVTSKEQLGEIARALAYPKIQRILKWDAGTIERFLEQLYLRAQMVDIAHVGVKVPQDPRDAPILATFVAAEADCLITGDDHLLALRDQNPIMTPADFVRTL